MAIRTDDIVLSSREAAEFLGLATASIPVYVERKLLIPHSRVGRAFVFTKTECERFKKLKRSRGNPNFTKTAADVPASRRRKAKTAAKA